MSARPWFFLRVRGREQVGNELGFRSYIYCWFLALSHSDAAPIYYHIHIWKIKSKQTNMEDMLLYSSLSLLLLLVAFKLFLHRKPRHKHLPPSPPSLPILGHLHLVKRPLHRYFHSLSQTYGQVFSLRFGSRLVVVVSSPSAVEECFTKNDVIFANRPRSLAGKYFGYNHTTVVSAPYGDH